jgi:hypothetical protein
MTPPKADDSTKTAKPKAAPKTKKPSTPKPDKKVVKKSAPKKAIKGAAKPKAVPAVKKAAKAEKKIKKSTTKKPVKKAGQKFSKIETFAAEAIAALATPEKEFVSYGRIKQYVLDYLDGGLATTIPKLTKNALIGLTATKLLKAKKDSYAFTAKGKETLAPATVEKRKKVVRPVKEKKKQSKQTAPEPLKKVTITLTGRATRPRY